MTAAIAVVLSMTSGLNDFAANPYITRSHINCVYGATTFFSVQVPCQFRVTAV